MAGPSHPLLLDFVTRIEERMTESHNLAQDIREVRAEGRQSGMDVALRIERLQKERQHVKRDVAALFTDAGRYGFNTAILREMIDLRAMPVSVREEHEASRALYKSALELG